MENSNLESFKDSSPLSLSFNQDYSCFAIGTQRGFKIYPTYPCNDGYEKIFYGGIKICEMLNKSNFLALVGGGRVPKYCNKKVVIFNDFLEKIETEFKFTMPVLNLKIKKDLIFIVCIRKIYVFNLETCQNIDSLDTTENQKGLIAISNNPNYTIMAHPIEFEDDVSKGYVSIKNFKTNKYFPLLVQEDSVSSMCMDYNGLLLATANEKGTLIRIHSCDDGTLLQECKRGKEKADIGFMCFDFNYNYIGATSDRGTIHIWTLDSIVKKTKKNNNKDNFVYIEKNDNDNSIKIKEDFSDEEIVQVIKNKNYRNDASFAKIRINYQRCVFCFKPKNTVVIITYDGKYFLARIDPQKGGDCVFNKVRTL